MDWLSWSIGLLRSFRPCTNICRVHGRNHAETIKTGYFRGHVITSVELKYKWKVEIEEM